MHGQQNINICYTYSLAQQIGMTGMSLRSFSVLVNVTVLFYEIRRNYVEAISIKYYECVSAFLP